MFKTALMVAALEALVEANSTPIYGTYPGYTAGKGTTGIEVDLFFDYLCSACQAENPVINELRTTEWKGMDGTYEDLVTFRYTPFPLPYHTHAYQVNQLVPYFMNMCIADSTKCFSDDYRNFAFDQQSTILSMKDTSKDDFITYWSKAVATQLGVDASAIEASYSDSSRLTDMSLRDMWKYAAARGVYGTPSVFINGVAVDNVPFNVLGWKRLLNQVYNSQFSPN